MNIDIAHAHISARILVDANPRATRASPFAPPLLSTSSKTPPRTSANSTTGAWPPCETALEKYTLNVLQNDVIGLYWFAKNAPHQIPTSSDGTTCLDHTARTSVIAGGSTDKNGGIEKGERGNWPIIEDYANKTLLSISPFSKFRFGGTFRAPEKYRGKPSKSSLHWMPIS